MQIRSLYKEDGMKTAPVINHDAKDFGIICRDFKWVVPEYLNLAQDLCDKYADEPERVALLFEDENGREQKLNFGQLIELSNKFANVLQSLGVNRGDRISVIMGQRPETLIAHIGIYKIGAIALPLSVLFQKDALSFRLQDSEAKVVVIGGEDADKIRDLVDGLPHLQKRIIVGEPQAGSEIGFWKAMEKASSDFHCCETKANDPALLIYTSGTTGPPKGALHAHRFLIGHFPGFELSHNLFPKDADVFWSPADWAWGGGLFDALFPCLHYGAPTLAFREGKFNPEKVLHMMNKYKIRNSFIWPTGLKMIRQIKDIRSSYPSLSLRSIAAGGEPMGEEVVRWAEEELGVTINEIFGQTEANYMIGNCSAIFKVKAGAMGKPYPGHHVDVIDEGGNPKKAGEVGEVVMKRPDPVLFLGYWRNEEATRKKFLGDWWLTGDLARKDEDGYFWYVGRKDDIICSGGYRIGPSEIENCLMKHPAVGQAAAVGSPDPTRGEIVKAFIKLSDAGYEPSEDLKKQLQEHVKKHLAFYEYPREIEFIDEFPMTTTGKVQRAQLKQREIERKKASALNPVTA